MSPSWSREQDIAGVPNRTVLIVEGDDTEPGMVAVATNTDPASPYHADQLPLYGSKRLVPLPFTQEQILADGSHRRITVSDK